MFTSLLSVHYRTESTVFGFRSTWLTLNLGSWVHQREETSIGYLVQPQAFGAPGISHMGLCTNPNFSNLSPVAFSVANVQTGSRRAMSTRCGGSPYLITYQSPVRAHRSYLQEACLLLLFLVQKLKIGE